MHSQDVDPIVGSLFWADSQPSRGPSFDAVLLPGRAAPTVVVPRRPRRAAAAVLGAHSTGATGLRRARRLALVSAASVGAVDLAGPRRSYSVDQRSSLFDVLAEVVGQPVVLGAHLGPPRANRKPVLQVLSERGRTLAFVKVGVDDLTRRLLASEATALDRVAQAGLRSVVAPRVIERMTWRDYELLVLSPVRTTALRRPSPALVRTAMLEISGLADTSSKRLVDSACWHDAVVALEGGQSAAADALLDIVASMDSESRGVVLRVGGWHGDWAPWNVSRGGRGQLVVWDWERFGDDAPLGFDALHFDVQRNLRVTGPRSALRQTVDGVNRLLAPLDVPVEVRRWVLAGYLVVIGARYLRDDQAAAGSRVGDLGKWLLPELAGVAAGLVSRRSAEELK